MNMRKIIAVLAAVLMLCAIVPMNVFAAPGDVILQGNFDDDNKLFSGNATIEDGALHWDTSAASWAHLTKGVNLIANTNYVVSFKMKSSHTHKISVKFMMHDWATQIASVKVAPTTDWAEYSVILNTGDNTSILFMIQSGVEASVGQQVYLDDFSIAEYVEPVVFEKDFNDGAAFENGSNENGYMVFNATTADWANVYSYTNGIEANTNYLVSFRAKANKKTSMNFKLNNNWAGDTCKWTVNVTSDWKEYSAVVNSGALTSTALVMFTSNATAANGAIYHIDDVRIVKAPSNPVSDGSFESGAFVGGAGGWRAGAQAAFTKDHAYSGTTSLLLQSDKAWANINQKDIAIEANTDYVISFAYKRIAGTGAWHLYPNIDSSTKFELTDGQTWFNGTGSDWTIQTMSFNSGSKTSMRIYISCETTDAVFAIDNVYLTKKIEYDDVIEIEPSNDGYIINGDFETGKVAPWDNLWGGCPKAEAVAGGKDSNYALEIVSGQWQHVRQTNIAVQPNTTYKVTAWAKNAKNMSLLVKDGGDSKDLKNVGVNAGDEWTEFTGYFNSGDYSSIIFSLMGSAAEAYGTFDNVSISVHTHNYVGNVTKEPTCGEDGVKTFSCTCGEGTYTEPIPATGEHEYAIDNEKSVWPTCDTEGTVVYTCSKCSDSYTQDLPAYHNGGMEYNPAKEAIDCANPGNIENWYCPGCNEYFADAYATSILNPWFINITVDCVRPEGVADCATVVCETCGNDIYGYGEHDVLVCQGGICSKCNTEIEGAGCANYDTPACEDGICYYCGGFVAGFGHENGAWAPCLDGECTYGCGLLYPATEDHVDADADDYCDNCWNHLACIDEDADGWCDVCWSEIVCNHVYSDDYDVDCNECGDIREIECPITSGGNSISEDVNGLAFKFDLSDAISGLTLQEGTKFMADYTNATVGGYKLVTMGAVVTNNGSITRLENVDGVHVVNVVAAKVDVTENFFAVRILNIPESARDTEIAATPYFIYENEAGEQIVFYGAEVTNTYNGAQGN